MKRTGYKYFLAAGMLLLLFSGFVQTAKAQVEQDTAKTIKSDTSQIKRELKQRYQGIISHFEYDRSTYKYLVPESQRYNVPAPTQYYKPPFTGKQSLDAAMHFLREELNNSITNSRVYRIIAKIAPFINNVFTFGYYNQLPPVIAPDNPYLFPQTQKGKAWRNFMLNRDSSQPEEKE
jgi:hypothetical protein